MPMCGTLMQVLCKHKPSRSISPHALHNACLFVIQASWYLRPQVNNDQHSANDLAKCRCRLQPAFTVAHEVYTWYTYHMHTAVLYRVCAWRLSCITLHALAMPSKSNPYCFTAAQVATDACHDLHAAPESLLLCSK